MHQNYKNMGFLIAFMVLGCWIDKYCYNGEIGYIIDLIYVTLIRRKSEILAAIESYLISLTLWK
jgi:hypothetical protein